MKKFKNFSEAPYLPIEMAANHIKVVQGQSVSISLSNFDTNKQDHLRMSIDAIVEERFFLKWIYLVRFEGAVNDRVIGLSAGMELQIPYSYELNDKNNI